MPCAASTLVHADLIGFRVLVAEARTDERTPYGESDAAGERNGTGCAAAMDVDAGGGAAAASGGAHARAAGDADAAAAQLAGIACELEQCVPNAQPGRGYTGFLMP